MQEPSTNYKTLWRFRSKLNGIVLKANHPCTVFGSQFSLQKSHTLKLTVKKKLHKNLFKKSKQITINNKSTKGMIS